MQTHNLLRLEMLLIYNEKAHYPLNYVIQNVYTSDS